jgi:hypothetical protein
MTQGLHVNVEFHQYQLAPQRSRQLIASTIQRDVANAMQAQRNSQIPFLNSTTPAHIIDMSITEASRFQPRTAIGQILSEEAADTLMELLPPVGWADVATKTDLQHLQLTIEVNVRKLIHEQTKWLITTMIAMNAVTVAVAVALSKLI